MLRGFAAPSTTALRAGASGSIAPEIGVTQSSHVLDFPDSLKAKNIGLNTATSNKDVVLQIVNNSIDIRPTVNRDFVKGAWVSGGFPYQLA